MNTVIDSFGNILNLHFDMEAFNQIPMSYKDGCLAGYTSGFSDWEYEYVKRDYDVFKDEFWEEDCQYGIYLMYP